MIGSAIANNNKPKIKTNEVISWVSDYVRTTDDKSIFFTGTDDVLKKDIKIKSIKLVGVINNFCKSRKIKFNILAKMNPLVDGPELVAQEKILT